MNIVRSRNTKKRGIMEFLFLREDNGYIGICLTFDIIEEDTDFELLKKNLLTAAYTHLECVQKENLSDDLLNRYAPEKYWKIYLEVIKEIQKAQIERMFPKKAATTEQVIYPHSQENKRVAVPA